MRRFTWGELVRVTPKAPAEYRSGQYAWVVGIQIVPDETVMYTVEYEDGSSQEIDGRFLQNVRDQHPGVH